MIKILQINIRGSRTAQDLMYATAVKMDVNVILVSEQYKTTSENDGQYSDVGRKAAVIVVRNTLSLDKLVQVPTMVFAG